MKSKLLLVGAGGFGRVALEHAMPTYDCAFVDDGKATGELVCNTPVVGKIADLKELFSEYKLLVVVIGNNKLREAIYKEASAIGYTFPNIICSTAYVSPFSEIGSGCVFLNNVVVQNGSHVGNGVLLNPGVEIHHDSFIDDYSLVYTNSVIRTNAKVGKRVRIGSNVTISNDTFINNDSDIANGTSIK